MAEIEGYLQAEVARREGSILNALAQVGEQCVNQARSAGSYTDQTSNLRSSTGYVIAIDGRIVLMSAFDPVKPEGRKGSQDGKHFARSLVSGFPRGIVLIVVAGMRYASAVSARGKDVLDSAELLAEQLVPSMMRRLGVGN
jgi:hypothetical protein